MDHLIWTSRPRLRRPVLISAFEGWSDAGEAATFAARYLADQWGARPFATIDPEEFYDFTSTRPHVRLDDEQQREIVWPGNELSACSVPGADLDVIVLIGHEPQLRWRTFCAEVVEVAKAHEVRLAVSLGALLAEVPHSRPVPVVGTAYDPDLVRRLDLRKSTYEGPTGILGVLHDALRQAGVPSASLWATVPTYVPGAPSPKAALALIERMTELLAVPVQTADLQIATAAYERQLDELVADDDDTAAYVAGLEQAADEAPEPEAEPDPARLIEEVERFLRDNPST